MGVEKLMADIQLNKKQTQFIQVFQQRWKVLRLCILIYRLYILDFYTDYTLIFLICIRDILEITIKCMI